MTDPIQLTRLPSGLTVVTERMDRVETVSFGAYISAGTRNETAAENGVSHFLEHMAFKGTTSRSALRIAEEIENVGGHINAYTAREQTVFYVKLLKENLGLGIDIIGDILTHSTFDAAELERERGVILQEIGQANDTPDDVVFDHFQETAFPNQPMGRPILGTEALIKGMQRDTLTSYMRTHYNPANMIVAAAGNLEHQAVVAQVEQHFAHLPTTKAPAMEAAHYAGGEFRQIKELDQAHIVLGFPSTGYHDPDYYAALLLSTYWVGACPHVFFRKSGKNAGWYIRSIPLTPRLKAAACLAFMPARGKRNAQSLFP